MWMESTTHPELTLPPKRVQAALETETIMRGLVLAFVSFPAFGPSAARSRSVAKPSLKTTARTV